VNRKRSQEQEEPKLPRVQESPDSLDWGIKDYHSGTERKSGGEELQGSITGLLLDKEEGSRKNFAYNGGEKKESLHNAEGRGKKVTPQRARMKWLLFRKGGTGFLAERRIKKKKNSTSQAAKEREKPGGVDRSIDR